MFDQFIYVLGWITFGFWSFLFCGWLIVIVGASLKASKGRHYDDFWNDDLSGR